LGSQTTTLLSVEATGRVAPPAEVAEEIATVLHLDQIPLLVETAETVGLGVEEVLAFLKP
jgi:hypothetical protein